MQLQQTAQKGRAGRSAREIAALRPFHTQERASAAQEFDRQVLLGRQQSRSNL